MREANLENQYKKAEGYKGIWYWCNSLNGRYPYKYSGGYATYTANHIPMAYYAEKANKTFFVYGGTKGLHEKNRLLAMVSYYDHETGMVPKPTMVLEKGTDDAHHNPTIQIDEYGYIWIFISSHGGDTGFIYKSVEPYFIDSFERIEQREFTYPQPWYFPRQGFLFLFTKYTKGRELYWRTSPDSIMWSEDQKLAGFGGHYQISRRYENKVGTAFQYHPKGVDTRTNLYYVETSDFGKTWRNVQSEKIETPLDSPQNIALVHHYESEGLLVYLNDINFDSSGNPVIQYVTSRGWRPGPDSGSRTWKTAHWTGVEWEISDVTESDHNYDTGSIYIEADGLWRIIGPTEPGPQHFFAGGEVAVWTSKDQGHSWTKQRQVTLNSKFNHTYVRRPVNAHSDFYAFWADGHGEHPSDCSLYFTNQSGEQVLRLPRSMTKELEKPQLVTPLNAVVQPLSPQI